jgi:hypothetical protein
MKLNRAAIAASALVLSLTASSFARQIENWPYDRLYKEADLVVIAPAKCVADAGETLKKR